MPTVRCLERRRFLRESSSAVAVGFAAPTLAGAGFFAAGSDRLRIGLVGCGGRGTGAAIEAAGHDRGLVVSAIGDLCPAAVDETAGMLARRLGGGFDAPPDRRFAGIDACEQVCAADIDAVILAAPAGVRPEHVAMAVGRGLHVYAERPLAADLRGLDAVARSGRLAAARGLSFVTSLSLRYDPQVAAAVARVRSMGDGVREIVAVEMSGGLAAERCLDVADAALAALGGHGEEWSAHPTRGGFVLRSVGGRSIRIVLDASSGRHGRMIARHTLGSVEFVTPESRRRATAAGLSAAWAALLGSIRLGRPINDAHEACRAGVAMLSPSAALGSRSASSSETA